MQASRTTRFALALLLTAAPSVAVSLGGCSDPPAREAETDYDEVSPLIYDYGLVFDCVAEMIADEGFQVGRADRDGGTLETKDVPEHEDLLRHVQAGHRIHARVLKTGDKSFVVKIAASKIERDYSANVVGEWRYLGRDADLMDRLKKRFDKEVEKRYKPKTDRN